MGGTAEGTGCVSLGTAGVVLAARGAYAPAPEAALHTFCHAVPDRWMQMGVMLSATDSLSWLSELTSTTPEALTTELGEALQGPGPVRFFPYLSGERTPHNDADVRGGFMGLSRATGRKDMTRAVLEGVAFGLLDGFEAIRVAGGDIQTMYVIGGGAASTYWTRLLATVLDTPLLCPTGGEAGAALGAARLGMVAATGLPVDAIMTPPEAYDVIEPDVNLTCAFDDAYAAFRASHPTIKDLQ
jgi:xylulokinase